MAVDLTLGDVSGTPPTGNVVKFYTAYDGLNSIGEYPSSNNYVADNQINYKPTLDGTGIHQAPINDTRLRELLWEYIDLDVYDAEPLGGFVYELRQRIYSVSGLDYYIGATDMHGAYFFRVNPIHIRIIDLITDPVQNSANRKIANVRMRYHQI